VFNRMTKAASQDDLCVPPRVVRRARQVSTGSTKMWVEQTLYLVGSNVTHHRPGDPLLDEAIQSAQALLALLVEMKERERGL
jgi:hypothetical protein